jgi:hypothetical protein
LEGEHGRSELSEVVGTEGGDSGQAQGESPSELSQVVPPAPPELKEVGIVSPHESEQNRTEKGPALYGDRRQEVLSWALSEARRGTLPEPSEALALPSGQRIAAGGAAGWLQEAQKRAEGLSHMGAVSVDAERAFLMVRQDMRALSILAADASRELLLLAELEDLAAELEGDLPELESASL